MKKLNHFQRLFIILCLAAVLVAQDPPRYYRKTSPADWTKWVLMRFAYATALDNVWEMFSYAHRDYYRLVFIGEKPSDKNIILQLPNQSEQNFFSKWFFNFREEKFLLNIFGKKQPLDAYINYLCRNAKEGKLSKIRIEIQRSPILSLTEARQKGSALAPTYSSVMQEGPCLN